MVLYRVIAQAPAREVDLHQGCLSRPIRPLFWNALRPVLTPTLRRHIGGSVYAAAVPYYEALLLPSQKTMGNSQNANSPVTCRIATACFASCVHSCIQRVSLFSMILLGGEGDPDATKQGHEP